MVDELVMERFRLLERLGSGGMGTVYRGFDERLQRNVAVKVVEGQHPERVIREAQAAARLNHPGIVTLYELGEHGGRALLVSELVDGETLAAMHRRGELTDRDVGIFACELCEALAHAHSRGVVHRDVKPDNVIVPGPDGPLAGAKLLDFGIARVSGAPTLTAAGEVVGTLAYMSPEQAEGAPAGPESDVYSLALTVYECLSGENPVGAETPAATARRIGEPVAPLSEARPDLPATFTEALDDCLLADPELRPGAAELADLLAEDLDRLDPGNPVPLPDGAPQPTAAGADMARIAVVLGTGAALVALAGPFGAAGLALVLGALLLPLLAIAPTPGTLLVPLSPLLGYLGATPACAALGAAGPSAAVRAALGAASWLWLAGVGLAIGTGPDLGLGDPAPPGWASDPRTALDSVLAPLVSGRSVLAALTFAVAAAVLGWVLAARHLSIVLLGAMLWAAGLSAALAAAGVDNRPAAASLAVVTAAAAVALEFRARRGWAWLRPAGRIGKPVDGHLASGG